VSALEEQLHALAGQRDAAVLQLSTAREEAESNAAALHNLQSVLEQFQRDQSSELSEALKRSQIELATALSDRETVQSHNITLQNQLKEAKAGVDVLCQQLVERDTKVEELKQKVTGLQSTLHSTEGAMEKLMREEGGRVDQYVCATVCVYM
jgi:chromosome segregation ATPase